jgi:hypothetical protein
MRRILSSFDMNVDMIAPIKSNTHFFSFYLQGINVCCNSALKTYTAATREKVHPSENQSNIEALNTCVSSVSQTASQSCGEEYSAMKDCLSGNKREWVKCQDLKKGLDICLVKSKAGELAN